MKIIIENVVFPYDIGCKLLKLKDEECPFEDLQDIWNDIVPLTFKEIAQLKNLEQRRICINHLGIDRLVGEVNPKLIDKQTIEKTTTWINENNELETIKFSDTYELYEVEEKALFGTESWNSRNNKFYVKCKDTSTDREYLIWVDIHSVHRTNGGHKWNIDEVLEDVNAIQCIAWTITTNVDKGNIEKIIRQGDCILIKPKRMEFGSERHLTEQEYRELLEVES